MRVFEELCKYSLQPLSFVCFRNKELPWHRTTRHIMGDLISRMTWPHQGWSRVDFCFQERSQEREHAQWYPCLFLTFSSSHTAEPEESMQLDLSLYVSVRKGSLYDPRAERTFAFQLSCVLCEVCETLRLWVESYTLLPWWLVFSSQLSWASRLSINPALYLWTMELWRASLIAPLSEHYYSSNGSHPVHLRVGVLHTEEISFLVQHSSSPELLGLPWCRLRSQ